jgi:hypothetical protein
MIGMRVVGIWTANASLSKLSWPSAPSVRIVACPVFLLLGARAVRALCSGLEADRSGVLLECWGLLATVSTAWGGGCGVRGLTAMARISSRVFGDEGRSLGGGLGGVSIVLGVWEWKRR